MVMTLSTFSSLLEKNLKKVWGDDMAQWSEEYSKIFDMETSDKAYEYYQEISGFGQIPIKTQGGNISYTDALQGYLTTVTNVTYAGGYSVTMELMEDEQYGKIKRMNNMLAKSVRDTVETLGANVLNRAFNGSYLGADGVVLCATDHPLPGGGTYSNRPVSHADLSETSLEQATIDIAAYTDGAGLKTAAVPKLLIIHQNDSYVAAKLLNSAQVPESANNAINPAKGIMDFMVDHYLTDEDAWFIRTDIPGLMCQKRKFPAQLMVSNDVDNLNVKVATLFRLAFSWYNARSIYGSAGI